MAEEGTEAEKLRFGEEIRIGDPKWVQFLPEVGQILEAVLTPGDAIKEEAKIAILVTEVKEETDGELIYVGRFVGSENEEIGEVLLDLHQQKGVGRTHMSRKSLPWSRLEGSRSRDERIYLGGFGVRCGLHEGLGKNGHQGVCRQEDHQEKEGSHKEERTPTRVGEGGRRLQRHRLVASLQRVQERTERKRKTKRTGRKRSRRKVRSQKKAQELEPLGLKKDRGNVAGLRAKLAALRKRLDGHGRDEQEEIIDVDALSEPEEPEAFWPFAEVPPLRGLGAGDHLGSRVSQLALAGAVKQEDTKGGTWSRKKKVRVKKNHRVSRRMGTASFWKLQRSVRRREEKKRRRAKARSDQKG